MSFKERIKKIGHSIKEFFSDHGEEVALVTGLVALTGAGCYAYYRVTKDGLEKQQKIYDEIVDDYVQQAVAERGSHSWQEEYDDDWMQVDVASGQLEHIDGYSWLIAGPNGWYNDDPEKIRIYMVDNDGYYITPPDDYWPAPKYTES